MKFIEIDYSIEGKTFNEKFDIDLKFSIFMMIVEVTHKINFQYYEIFYLNQKLPNKYYFYPMKDIIRIDLKPFFRIERVKSISQFDNSNKGKNLILKSQIIEITISDFPSKVEMINIIDKELEKEKQINKFQSVTTDENIIVRINGLNLGMKLFATLNYLKANLQQYSRLAVKMKVKGGPSNNNYSTNKSINKTNNNLLSSERSEASDLYSKFMVR